MQNVYGHCLSQVKKQICPGLSTLSKVGGYFEKVSGERRAKRG